MRNAIFTGNGQEFGSIEELAGSLQARQTISGTPGSFKIFFSILSGSSGIFFKFSSCLIGSLFWGCGIGDRRAGIKRKALVRLN
jgi:hypothetical protein